MRLALLLALPLSLACTTGARDPAPQPPTVTADGTGATVRWNQLVPRLVDEAAADRRAARAAAVAAHDSSTLRRLAQSPPPLVMRVYILLSVAQYGAAASARGEALVSPEAAIATASARVLADFFPDSTPRRSIGEALARDLQPSGAAAGMAERVDAGRRVGEAVARRVLAEAPPFRIVAPWNGTIPTGPGMWYSARGVPPIGIAIATSRPWVLDSMSQFRPAPPPAFGSREWQAAMDEVRRVSRERTPEQVRIAQKWNAGDPWALWNDVAIAAIRRHALSDMDAARVLAVLNVASADAAAACFDAKYHYWTIRPSQADTTLVLADSVGLPNFPSFPSGHACSAGAFDAVLGHYFPAERAGFTTMAEEQAMSRLYGGIHYRFDNDGGLALGRTVARHVVERETRGALDRWKGGGTAAAGRP